MDADIKSLKVRVPRGMIIGVSLTLVLCTLRCTCTCNENITEKSFLERGLQILDQFDSFQDYCGNGTKCVALEEHCSTNSGGCEKCNCNKYDDYVKPDCKLPCEIRPNCIVILKQIDETIQSIKPKFDMNNMETYFTRRGKEIIDALDYLQEPCGDKLQCVASNEYCLNWDTGDCGKCVCSEHEKFKGSSCKLGCQLIPHLKSLFYEADVTIQDMDNTDTLKVEWTTIIIIINIAVIVVAIAVIGYFIWNKKVRQRKIRRIEQEEDPGTTEQLCHLDTCMVHQNTNVIQLLCNYPQMNSTEKESI